MTSTSETKEGSGPKPASGFVGAIDQLRDGFISGWGVTRVGGPCTVMVTVNDEHRFEVAADRPRPDLAAKQLSTGLGGWRVDVRSALRPGENRIAVTFPDGSPLPGSPLVDGAAAAGAAPSPPAANDPAPNAPLPPAAKQAAKRYIGAIDAPDKSRLSGWSVATDRTPAPVTIQVNQGPPMEIQANGPRPDLAAKNLSNGEGGWHLDVTAALVHGRNVITVRFPDGSDLSGSPIERYIGMEAPAKPPVAPPPPARSSPPDHARAVSPTPPAPVVAPKAAAPEPRRVTTPPVSRPPAPRIPAPTQTAPTPQVPKSEPGPAKLPSLSELDELSLDDVSLAVASGRVRFDPPEMPEPTREIPVETVDAREPALDPAEPAPRGSFLARLFRRNRAA